MIKKPSITALTNLARMRAAAPTAAAPGAAIRYRDAVLHRAAVRVARLAIDHHRQAQRGCLVFEAYGLRPLRALRFSLCNEAGAVLHEIIPVEAAGARAKPAPPACAAMLLRLEHGLRRLLRRPIRFYLDIPAACLTEPFLQVRAENVGTAPIFLYRMRMYTSTVRREETVENRHAIEGYADKISYHAGDEVELFVHAPQRHFNLRVTRYGAAEQQMLTLSDLPGAPQRLPLDAFENGARWAPSLRFKTGALWRSGMYAATLSDDGPDEFDIVFIVKKSAADPAAGLAVLASTNTWQAYNAWGGASIYSYDLADGIPRKDSYIVNTARPNPAASPRGDIGHLANAERHVLGWLETQGIAYDLYADMDLHNGGALLDAYPSLLVNTHSEYWSAPMYGALEQFMGRGGNLAYLSGNGFYWKTVIVGDRLEVRFDSSGHTLVDEAGGRWRDCGRYETDLIGVRYTRAGYRSGFKPYKVLHPAHWSFAGTGVRRGDLMGGAGRNRGGASGWELDKIDPRHVPAGLVHLAKGTNGYHAGADMVYFTHPGGGGVFSVGSITFGGSLAGDAVLACVLRNVLDRFAA